MTIIQLCSSKFWLLAFLIFDTSFSNVSTTVWSFHTWPLTTLRSKTQLHNRNGPFCDEESNGWTPQRPFLPPGILEFRQDKQDVPSVVELVDKVKKFQTKYDSVDKVYDLAVKKNLPKRSKSSIHSFISTVSAVAAALLLLPTFHPGFDDLGFPRLFDYEYASVDLLWQSQAVAILQLLGSVLGVFRLPKHSPDVRTAGFVISALVVAQLSLVVISSLNGTDVYLFDAFSIQGRILVSVVNTALLIGSFDSLTLIVGDKAKDGWEHVPNYRTRFEAFAGVFAFHLLICITGNAALPVLCDKESFVQNAMPFYAVYPGVQTLGYVATSLAVGLGALFATLQFERKISVEVASFWNIAVLLFLTYDGVKFIYLLQNFPEKFPHSHYFTDYTPHLQSLWYTNEVLTIGTVVALAVGLQKFMLGTPSSSLTNPGKQRRQHLKLAREEPTVLAATMSSDSAIVLHNSTINSGTSSSNK